MSVREPLLDSPLAPNFSQQSLATSSNTCSGRLWRALSRCCGGMSKCVKTICTVTKNAFVETGKMLFTTSGGSLAFAAASAASIPYTEDHWQLTAYACLGCAIEHFDQLRKKERLLRSEEEKICCVTKSLDYLQNLKGYIGRIDNIIGYFPLMIHRSYPEIAYPLGAFLTGVAFTSKAYEIKHVWGKDKEITFKEVDCYTLLWYAFLMGGGLAATFEFADWIEDESYHKICKELGFLLAWKPVGTEALRFMHYSALILEYSTHWAVRCAKNIAQFFRSSFSFPSVSVAVAFTLRALYDEEEYEIIQMASMALLGFALGTTGPLFKSTVVPQEKQASPEMISRCKRICSIGLKAFSILIQLAILGFAVQDILYPSTENRLQIPYEGAVFIFSAFFMYYLRVFSRKSECCLGREIIDFTDKNLLASVVITLYLKDYVQSKHEIAYALIVATAFSIMIITDDALNGRGKTEAPGRLHSADTPYGVKVFAIV